MLPLYKGLLWCFAVLAAQLGLLRYIDWRVAAMPPLEAPATASGDEEAPALAGRDEEAPPPVS